MRRTVRTLLAFALATAPGVTTTAQQSPGSAPPKARAVAPARKPAAAPGAAKAKAAPDPRKLDQILRSWEVRSQSTTTLRATFVRIDDLRDWDTRNVFSGTAVLQSPNLAYLNFDQYGDDPKAKPTFSERIVCTGERVYHFQADTRQVHIYQLAREDKQRAMEEGPLPFLFNMKADQAKARYKMALLREEDTRWLIRIDPLKEVDREAFSTAFVTLDKASFLPTEIVLSDPSNGKDTKTYRFLSAKGESTIVRNAAVAPSYFDGQKQATDVRAAGWDLVAHGPDGKPLEKPAPRRALGARPPAGAADPARAMPQPAQRPMQAPRR